MQHPYSIVRQIRCGALEAVIVQVPAPYGRIRYAVFFRRVPQGSNGQDHPFLAFNELLIIAKLARLAHANLADLALLDDRDEDEL